MAIEQIVVAKEGAETSNLGTRNSLGDINIAVRDYDALQQLSAILSELQVQGDGVQQVALPADYPIPAVQLQQLLDALDAIEISADAINVNADTIGLSVDDLETINGQIRDLLAGTISVNTGLAPLEDGGNVTVTNLPATYPDQHEQPVTDAELRAAPVVVDTGLTPLEDGGEVAVNNLPNEYPDTVQQSYLENRYGGGRSSYSVVLSSAGVHQAVTPSAGKSIEVVWVAFIPNSDNPVSNLVSVGTANQTWYTGYAIAHWEIFNGGVDEPITVTTENEHQVAVTIHYKEV